MRKKPHTAADLVFERKICTLTSVIRVKSTQVHVLYAMCVKNMKLKIDSS